MLLLNDDHILCIVANFNVQFFVRFFFVIYRKMGQDDQTSPTNPMLYDPIPDGNGEAQKRNQFIATAISK